MDKNIIVQSAPKKISFKVVLKHERELKKVTRVLIPVNNSPEKRTGDYLKKNRASSVTHT